MWLLGGSLSWDTSQLHTVGILKVVAGGGVDFNGNGTIDAADYVLWRNNNGPPVQYTTWRSTFGGPAGGSFANAESKVASAVVPEPASLLLMLGELIVIFGRRATVAIKIGRF
jgi:hypothetical protein